MARKGDFRFLALGLVAIWASACGGEEPAASVDRSSAALTTENALTANALTANALTANALTANGLKDPLARELMKYVVSCALPDDQTLSMTIDGKKYSFPGGLGLAPEWGRRGGSCDESCQRWVSACVLGRVDFLGVEEIISERGANLALLPTLPEMLSYPNIEATYYGNIFADGQPMYACLPPGKKQIPRVCGPSLDNCPMQVVGNCAPACGHMNLLGGGYVDCSAAGKKNKSEVYHESITVFLSR
ncbi:MAG TPA: hypothetical protein VHK47_17765 [Polyangia bacterium]|nr:hypothetical protein [Polyangia bacterium]